MEHAGWCVQHLPVKTLAANLSLLPTRCLPALQVRRAFNSLKKAAK